MKKTSDNEKIILNEKINKVAKNKHVNNWLSFVNRVC